MGHFQLQLKVENYQFPWFLYHYLGKFSEEDYEGYNYQYAPDDDDPATKYAMGTNDRIQK